MLACEKRTSSYPEGRTGTVAGWKAHVRKKEPTCDPCRLAYREYKQRRTEERRKHELICEVPTPAHPDGRTGTLAGVRAHRQANKPLCDACAEAADRYSDGAGQYPPMLEKAVLAHPYEPKEGWRRLAACRGLSPSIFIQSVEEAQRRAPVDHRAMTTCESCSVQLDCAFDNLGEEFGVWGGLSANGRRTLRKVVGFVKSTVEAIADAFGDTMFTMGSSAR